MPPPWAELAQQVDHHSVHAQAVENVLNNFQHRFLNGESESSPPRAQPTKRPILGPTGLNNVINQDFGVKTRPTNATDERIAGETTIRPKKPKNKSKKIEQKVRIDTEEERRNRALAAEMHNLKKIKGLEQLVAIQEKLLRQARGEAGGELIADSTMVGIDDEQATYERLQEELKMAQEIRERIKDTLLTGEAENLQPQDSKLTPLPYSNSLDPILAETRATRKSEGLTIEEIAAKKEEMRRGEYNRVKQEAADYWEELSQERFELKTEMAKQIVMEKMLKKKEENKKMHDLLEERKYLQKE